MTRVLTLPLRALTLIRGFVDPPLKAGRIPFTRAVYGLIAAAAVVFVGYTATKKGMQLPGSPKPYFVDVILPDANGLDPAKGPAAGVAGINVGRVTAVRIEGGRARATLRLPRDLRGRIFADASAFLRPSSILQTLIVDVTPGTPEAGPLPDGEPIPASRTGAFVHVDKLTQMLDADTQAQVQLLVSEAARALHGREPRLREILGRVGRLADSGTTLARAMDDRRRLLTRLMAHLDTVTSTLGDRGAQLARVVDSANRTLMVTATREPAVRAAVRELAPTLGVAQRSLVDAGALAASLDPALDRLLPVARRLTPLAAALRRTTPELDRLVTSADGLLDVGARPAHLFARGMRGLNARLRREAIPALRKLLTVSGALVESQAGLSSLANDLNAMITVNRRSGATVHASFVGFELGSPAEFGLPASAGRVRADGSTRLTRLIAEGLERTCRRNQPVACWLRLTVPALAAVPPVLATPSTERDGR